MSLTFFRSRFVFSVLAAVLACVAVPAVSAQTTTFTGKVYSPAGPATGDPIPNILVFVEDPNNPAPTFGKGISNPGQGCTNQTSLVPLSVLGSAITKPDGTFAFNVAGVLPDPVRLFIQAGKWRAVQSIPLNNIVVNGPNSYTLSMPSSAVAGVSDLPNIAVITGTADAVECIFSQIGINKNEVTDPGDTGHINLFLGGGTSGGEVVSTTIYTEAQLLNPSATGAIPISNYDLVIFGCDGDPASDTTNAVAYGANLVPYTSDGGRIFMTHYEWPWLANSFPAIATWYSTSQLSQASEIGQLDTAYSGEPNLYSWMNTIGALDVNTSANTPQFNLTNVRTDIKTMSSPAQSWVRLPGPGVGGDPSVQFSFDTPIGAGGTPVVSLNFSNVTSTGTAFLTGDPDDVVTVAVLNTSTTPTNNGLTLTLNIPSVLQVLSVVDSSGGAWSCAFTSPTYTCTLPGALAPGASDSVAISFKIPLGTPLGIYSLAGVLTKGGLNQSAQCGRVLYNDYHVENSVVTKSLWKNNSCALTKGKLTNAQKFLEYSLYNLSSFVAPANSDTIQIQASSTITWNPPSPTYYGTTIAQIENATVNTPGATTYTFTPNGIDLLDSNTYTFQANFAPTDSVDYLPNNATQVVGIKQDPTTAAINSLITPIYYGQEIGFENGVNATIAIATQAGLPNLITTPAVKGGTFTLTIDGNVECTGPGGTGVMGGAGNAVCPDANLSGYIAGTHALNLSYSGTIDFAAPTPYTATVVINSDPTTTTLTTTGTGSSTFGNNLTFTANVTDTYTQPVGTVTFYDSATPVSGVTTAPAGSQALYSTAVVNYSATFSLTTLAPGTHNIFACFVAPLDSQNLPNMLPTCSASTAQVVASLPISPSATQAFLTSSLNPSAFGQAVTFTATLSTTGAFVEIPTGTVTFYDGATVLGTGTLDSKGNASYTTSALTIGTHTMTVSYAGNGNLFTGSVSPAYSQVVVNALPSAGTGFIMQVTPTNITIPVGGSVSVNVTVIDLNNFQQQVQLSCAGLPSEGTCNFVQSLIPETGGSTQLLIGATSPHLCGSNTPFVAGSRGMGLLWLGATTLGLFLARKRRRMLQGIAVVAALLLLPALQGCGSGNCTDFGLKPGSYTFTVNGTSSGVVRVTGSGSTSATVVTRSQAMTLNVTVQ